MFIVHLAWCFINIYSSRHDFAQQFYHKIYKFGFHKPNDSLPYAPLEMKWNLCYKLYNSGFSWLIIDMLH